MSIQIEKVKNQKEFLKERNLKEFKDIKCENLYCTDNTDTVYNLLYSNRWEVNYIVGAYCKDCIKFMETKLLNDNQREYFNELFNRNKNTINKYLWNKSKDRDDSVCYEAIDCWPWTIIESTQPIREYYGDNDESPMEQSYHTINEDRDSRMDWTIRWSTTATNSVIT